MALVGFSRPHAGAFTPVESPPMAVTAYIRRIDDERVEAVQYTGANLDQVRAWVDTGFDGVTGDPQRVYVSQDAKDRGDGDDEVLAGDWVVRDDERVYAVRSYVFRGHCREAPIE